MHTISPGHIRFFSTFNKNLHRNRALQAGSICTKNTLIIILTKNCKQMNFNKNKIIKMTCDFFNIRLFN